MKNSLVCILLFSGFALSVQAQGKWTKISNFTGGKRERAVAFTIGNRGYMGTGQDNFNLTRNDFWEFDPGTSSWTQRADLPSDGRRDAVGFAIGSKGYIGTGINNADAFAGTILSDLWEYDPSTNVWSPKAPYPGGFGYGVYFSTAFVIGDKGYLCGGKIFSGYYSNELWEYDPSLDLWTLKSAFPLGERYGMSSFVIDSLAYVGMGADHNLFNHDFYRYDPVSNGWLPISPLPTSDYRAFCSAFSLNEKGYLALGDDGGYRDDVWQYNPTTDLWMQVNNFPGGARRSASCFTIGKAAYLGLGKGYAGTTMTLWMYTEQDTSIHHQDTIPTTEVREIGTGKTRIYPNPFTNAATFEINSQLNIENGVLSLFDLNGNRVKVFAPVRSNQIITRDNLAAGTYLYELTDGVRLIDKGKISIQ